MIVLLVALSSFSLLLTLCFPQTTIPLGSTLRASTQNDSWYSPNSLFALSFIPLAHGSSYAAAITISGHVPVWTAGGATVDSGATLSLLRNGALRLTNGSGYTVWDSGTAARGISSASLDDSGNLRLLTNQTASAWSSFTHPTDTLVPSQNFTAGMVLRSGNYSFSLLTSGNLTLSWMNTTVYWNREFNSSLGSNLTSPRLVLQTNGILMGFDSGLSTGVNIVYSTDYGEGNNLFRFMKLDGDGNLRIYSTTIGNVNQTISWAALTDQCRVYGYCGNLGICRYEDDKPVCGCPSQNFEFIDAKDTRRGCKRKVDVDQCTGGTSSVTMLELQHTLFLTYPPELYLSSQTVIVGIGACRANCLASGSSCVASSAVSDGTGLCYMKTLDFVSGYQGESLTSTSFLKVCGPVSPNPPPDLGKFKGHTSGVWIFAVVFAATLLVTVALLIGFWGYYCQNNPKYGRLSTQFVLLEYASGAPVQFSYKELQHATKGFREKLGEGGFGAVYKGILANKLVVAVKQLEGIEQGERQFRMEVGTISSTHHLNLVRLIGFCADGRHRLLVYEFMKNGSLDSFLFETAENSSTPLNWEQRFNIALGTARGITYLHEECRDCIVHCDIKPENILLDETYNSKVSDFGLAKLMNPKDQRQMVLSSIRGTRGYLAPEWLANNLPITSSSDVYSFGMVLLEIVSGRRNFEVSERTDHKKFSKWMYEEFDKGNVEGIIDKRLGDQELDMEQVLRAVEVSFRCIQEQPSLRPTMGKVVQMLEGVLVIEKPPAPKAPSSNSINGTSMSISSSNAGAVSFSAPPTSSLDIAGVGPTRDSESSSLLSDEIVQIP